MKIPIDNCVLSRHLRERLRDLGEALLEEAIRIIRSEKGAGLRDGLWERRVPELIRGFGSDS